MISSQMRNKVCGSWLLNVGVKFEYSDREISVKMIIRLGCTMSDQTHRARFFVFDIVEKIFVRRPICACQNLFSDSSRISHIFCTSCCILSTEDIRLIRDELEKSFGHAHLSCVSKVYFSTALFKFHAKIQRLVPVQALLTKLNSRVNVVRPVLANDKSAPREREKGGNVGRFPKFTIRAGLTRSQFASAAAKAGP